MSFAERFRRYGSTFITGVVAAFFVAALVSKVWPNASRPVFFGLTLFWLVGLVGVIVRGMRSREVAVFTDPSQWRADELPLEFRFITRETTLRELERRVGPSRPVADTGSVRYDLGAGGALFIHLDPPTTPDSRVRGVQLYRSEESVPVFG